MALKWSLCFSLCGASSMLLLLLSQLCCSAPTLSVSPLFSPSFFLSPLLLFLCVFSLSPVWRWQADLLHPLPATVLLSSACLSNKPQAGRHRGGGEESLRKRRGRRRRRRMGAGEGSQKGHQGSLQDSGCNRGKQLHSLWTRERQREMNN